MIEVLIISYNALPMDVVSSYRAKAYGDHLMSYGIRPTLLTHHWEKQADGNFLIHSKDQLPVVEKHETYDVIRLPYPGQRHAISKVHTIIDYLRSDFDVALKESYNIFRGFLFSHLKQKKYDVLLAIYSPHFHLKLAYECWREFKIPYVLDFRDLLDNAIVTKSYKPGIKKKLLDSIIKRAWKKWIRHALFFSTTGELWTRYLSQLSGTPGIVVRNGFEALDDNDPSKESRTPIFKIIHFGKIYENQDVDIFLEGFNTFAKEFANHEVSVEIIGLKKVADVDYHKKIAEAIPNHVSFIPYLPKDDLINYCSREASLFFFPNFEEDNGQFSVKIFDYMRIGKNIIVSPAGGEISEVVSALNAGVVLNHPSEVTQYLREAYRQFKLYGAVLYEADMALMAQYSRENQVRIMADQIRKTLSPL